MQIQFAYFALEISILISVRAHFSSPLMYAFLPTLFEGAEAMLAVLGLAYIADFVCHYHLFFLQFRDSNANNLPVLLFSSADNANKIGKRIFES